jgi:glycosyltransferase involved in cell wall biosynthesis
VTAAGVPMDVSVIIATRNRAELLAATLGHLARQEPGSVAWEAVVVDNGSRDGTPDVLRAPRPGLPLVALVEPQSGKNRAINRALESARGSLLLFSDDDVIADPRWVAEMWNAAGRWPNDDIFGGEVLLAFPDGTPPWLREPFHPALNFARYGANEPEGPTARLPNGPNFALRAAALAALRFSEAIGPDGTPGYAMGSETELLERLRARGARFIYVPGAVVQHVVQPHQLETRYLLGRSYRLGRGEVRRRGGRGSSAARLLGAPRHLWREAASEAAAGLASVLGGRERRLAAGLRLARLWGMISEHRAAPLPRLDP